MANPCAAGLVPNIDISNISETAKYTWLSLINQDNYEAAKNATSVDSEGNFMDLITGGEDISYDQFDQKRNDFLQQNAGSIDSASTGSIMRQSVPESARAGFYECMKGSAGLQAWFEDETDDAVSAVVHFGGDPGSSVNYRIELTGGNAVEKAHLRVVGQVD